MRTVGLRRVDEEVVPGAQEEQAERATQEGEARPKASLMLFSPAALVLLLGHARQSGFLDKLIGSLAGLSLAITGTNTNIHRFSPTPYISLAFCRPIEPG